MGKVGGRAESGAQSTVGELGGRSPSCCPRWHPDLGLRTTSPSNHPQLEHVCLDTPPIGHLPQTPPVPQVPHVTTPLQARKRGHPWPHPAAAASWVPPVLPAGSVRTASALVQWPLACAHSLTLSLLRQSPTALTQVTAYVETLSGHSPSVQVPPAVPTGCAASRSPCTSPMGLSGLPRWAMRALSPQPMPQCHPIKPASGSPALPTGCVPGLTTVGFGGAGFQRPGLGLGFRGSHSYTSL